MKDTGIKYLIDEFKKLGICGDIEGLTTIIKKAEEIDKQNLNDTWIKAKITKGLIFREWYENFKKVKI
jgi:hypothetical protein